VKVQEILMEEFLLGLSELGPTEHCEGGGCELRKIRNEWGVGEMVCGKDEVFPRTGLKEP
jgi:hypothetical protein